MVTLTSGNRGELGRIRYMGVRTWSLLLVLTWSALGCGRTDSTASAPTAVIEDAIKLLEAGEHARFLEDFMPPVELKRMTAGRTLDELADDFGRQKAASVLLVLQAARHVKGSEDSEGSRVSFELGTPVAGQTRLVLIKRDGRWRIF